MATTQSLYGLYFSNLASDSLSFTLFTIQNALKDQTFISDNLLVENSGKKSAANTLKLYYETLTVPKKKDD